LELILVDLKNMWTRKQWSKENDLLSSIQKKTTESDKDIDLAFKLLKTLEEQFGKENKVFLSRLILFFFFRFTTMKNKKNRTLAFRSFLAYSIESLFLKIKHFYCSSDFCLHIDIVRYGKIIEINNRKKKKHSSAKIFDYTKILYSFIQRKRSIFFSPMRRVFMNKETINKYIYIVLR
jgi:hypothetical protein